MKPPNLTTSRIFWASIAFLALWSIVGGQKAKTLSPTSPPTAFASIQGFFGESVSLLLTPARSVFSLAQGVVVSAANKLTVEGHAQESAESLRQNIAQLTDQIDQRDRQIRLDQERFAQLAALAPKGLAADELLAASVNGGAVGVGANLLTLDKGKADGVKVGMVVTACAVQPLAPGSPDSATTALIPQASILGLIKSVSEKTSTVLLLTDPKMRVQAVLVRRHNVGSDILTTEPCLVTGMGDSLLNCDTIRVDSVTAEPLPGDLLELADRDWPARLRYMIIGEVSNVARKSTQMLRYDLTIKPRVNINSVQTVLIVLNAN